MKELMLKLESIELNEGPDNEQHSGCLTKLKELLQYHQAEADAEGIAINGIELAEDLESFIENEYNAAKKDKGKLIKTNEILHNSDADDKLWNADRHTRELAQIILAKVNGIARRSMVDQRSDTYNTLLKRQIDKVFSMLSNDIADIRMSDATFVNKGDT